MNVNIDQKDIPRIRATRWKARTDLRFLAHDILGMKDIVEATHGPVIDSMQKFRLPPPEIVNRLDIVTPTRIEYFPDSARKDPALAEWLDLYTMEGMRRRLLIDSRGFLKTSLNCVAHSIQWLLNYPDVAILIFQAALEKAQDILKEIKSHFQYNPVFRDIFPDYCPQRRPDQWGNLNEVTLPNRKDFSRREPSIRIGSIEKGVAGLHPDILKFSDIVDEDNSKSETQVNKITYDFFQRENLLKDPARGWIDIEGTRYDYRDVYGIITDRWLDDKKFPDYQKRWQVFFRGCYKKKDAEYTPYDMGKEYEKDESGERVSVWPERFPLSYLKQQETDEPLAFACTPGWAPILMADWTECAIADVSIGDSIVGYSTGKGRRSLEKALVLDKGFHDAEVFKITTSSGSIIFSTDDHLWYNARSSERPCFHTPAVGRRLIRVYDDGFLRDFDKHAEDWNYLAGLIDGEGHVAKKQYNLTITQSETVNPEVSKEITKVLEDLHIQWNKHVRKDKKGGSIWWLKGQRGLRMALLRCPRFGKRNRVLSQVWRTSKKIGQGRNGREVIVSIESIGVQRVYWLTTTTGTYVSQGFASKNCQRLNNPEEGPKGERTFPAENFKIISTADFRKRSIAFHTVTVDTASTQNRRSHNSVVNVTAWDWDGRAVVVDVRLGKFQVDELIHHIFHVNTLYKPQNIAIEETEFVKGLKPSIARYEHKSQIYLPIKYLPRDTQTSKEDRIENTLRPWWMRGEIYFLETVDCLEHIKLEFNRFPKYMNDFLDTMADQFQTREWFGRLKPRPEEPPNFDEIVAKAQKASFERRLKGLPPGEQQGYLIPVPGDPLRDRTGGL